NIIGGSMIGGNYYSNYGYYDENGDGIGEMSYVTGMDSSYDALPLSNSNCLVPLAGQQLQKSVVLCSGTYGLSGSNTIMNITNSSVTLECNSTRLIIRTTSTIINSNPGSGQLSNITIKNCYFENMNTNVITITNTSQSYIHDNVFNISTISGPRPLYLYDVNASTIANNTFVNLSVSGGTGISIKLDKVSNTIFENNTMRNIEQGFRFAAVPSINITIRKNFINISKYAAINEDDLAILRLNDSKIYNNTFIDIGKPSSTSYVCILVSGYNNEFMNNTLTNCTHGITSGPSYGLYNHSGDNYYIKSNIITSKDSNPTMGLQGYNVTIINNTISYAGASGNIGTAGIWLTLTNNSYIAYNEITNFSVGIALTHPNYASLLDPKDGEIENRNITIEGNIINNATTYGIVLSGNNITVYNNIINLSRGKGTGSGIYGVNTNNSIIFNHTIYKYQSGISLYSSENTTIVNNTLYNNTAFGINITSSKNLSLHGNTIYNNSNYGIYLLKSLNNTILYNTLYNNTLSGIRLNSTNYTRIENNNITFNGGMDAVTATFYATAAPYTYAAIGAEYNFTGSGAGSSYNYQNGDSVDVINNKTDVSALVNGTANIHLALVKVNSSDAAYQNKNITLFFDDSIATSCNGIAAWLSDVALEPFNDETNCTYFQANIFTANSYNNYTYNGLTNSSISLMSGYLNPSLSVEVSSENKKGNIVILDSSDNNITNNTLTYSEYYGIFLDSSSNNTLTNNTMTRNSLNSAKAAGDSGSTNIIINSTGFTATISSSVLKVFWYLKVYASDNGKRFSELNISFTNKSGKHIASAITSSTGTGLTPEVMLIEYESDGSSTVYHTLYTISATNPLTGSLKTSTHNLSSSGLATIEIASESSTGSSGGGTSTETPGCTNNCGQETPPEVLPPEPIVPPEVKTILGLPTISESPSTQSGGSGGAGGSGGKKISQQKKECFESEGLALEEISLLQNALKMVPCEEQAPEPVKIKTEKKCNGLEIKVNNARFNIVYDGKPGFFLDLDAKEDKKDLCPWCNNNKKDHDETGIDCGGSCKPCPKSNEKALQKIQENSKEKSKQRNIPIFAIVPFAILITSLFLLRKKA
ncbi:right-handed parallel beta-helix repeat-containing protein, partial [Candidatus Woesearchaeota archaeon]|nr:right-handed parallel beta-helix repeat-containing protein [Candidatus Woesearchaeota archaeon]